MKNYNQNTITITKTSHAGNIAKHRKEANFCFQYTVLAVHHTGTPTEIITCRLYTTKATTYACVWIRSSEKNVYISGGGKATGYGDHKASAAVDSALADAGIKLDNGIKGMGDAAIRDVLHKIAEQLSDDAIYILEAHA